MKKAIIITALGLLSAAYAEPDLKHLKAAIGDIKVKEVIPTDVKQINGVSEVVLEGVNFPVYITNDGRYLIEGQITDLIAGENLTEKALNKKRIDALKNIDEKDMIIYKAPNETHHITVFTDVNCPYCKRLHDEMDQYMKAGVTVKYLAFPAIATVERMESVWCAKDPHETFTKAMNKESIENVSCKGDSPVRMQYAIGSSLGINGTPNIILEDGQSFAGYVPANEVIKVLKAKK